MARLIKKLSPKAGLPPGTLVHIGKSSSDPVSIEVFTYNDKDINETTISNLDDLQDPIPNKVDWINVYGVHDPSIVESIGKRFDIHPLVLEDIVNTGQRPKFEDYGNYCFIVLKMLSIDIQKWRVQSEQVSLILGSGFLISFQERRGDVFEMVRERLRKSNGKIRYRGSDYLLYALIDAVVDNYFAVLETIGDALEGMEEELLETTDKKVIDALYYQKRELIVLRKSIWPLREVIGNLQRQETEYIEDATKVYVRDVYDHTIQVIDTIESFRDVVAGLREMYMTNVSNRMNVIMKFLTIVATVFIPITFVAGLYGMNFKYMPELEWKYGYPLALGFMVALAGGMLWFFRKRQWF